MKFSIVTPLYNKALYIEQTIKSVLSQTYTDFELIVINDSSTDNSQEIVESITDPRVQLFTKPNGGVSAARNYGINKASGEVVCFLDADDIWEKNYLMELSQTIDAYPDCGFFCGAYKLFIDKPTNIVGIHDYSKFDERERFEVDFFESSVKMFGMLALTSAVSVKKDVLTQMDHWFDESVCRGEDNDMWVRIALKTKTAYNNNPLMLYRSDANDSLMNMNYNFNYSFKYWRWYSYSNNTNLNRLATQRIYSLARFCYKVRLYKESRVCLTHTKTTFLLGRRAVLLFLVMLKLLFNKIKK